MTVNVRSALATESLTLTLIVTEPLAPETGVNVSVAVLAGVVYTTVGFGTIVGSLEVAATLMGLPLVEVMPVSDTV